MTLVTFGLNPASFQYFEMAVNDGGDGRMLLSDGEKVFYRYIRGER